jgi:hypothetical protein
MVNWGVLTFPAITYKRRMALNTVIPAKAGIYRAAFWIPAFAGIAHGLAKAK